MKDNRGCNIMAGKCKSSKCNSYKSSNYLNLLFFLLFFTIVWVKDYFIIILSGCSIWFAWDLLIIYGEKINLLQTEKICIKLFLKYAKIEVWKENYNGGLKFIFLKKMQNVQNFIF